jgi:hypothetical protein
VSFRRIIVASLVVWAVIVLGTYVAGEQTEVVLLHTHDAEGKEWTTKMWIVDVDGATWIRVDNPERGWYRRLLEDPRVELERGGQTQLRLALPDASPEAAEAVDAAFAAKYGLVDRWYGLLVRHASVPIRLVPREPDS